jgi:gluconokinase
VTRLSTPAHDAVGPFVLGLDVGSGGSRAALYDATGREVGDRKLKVPHAFTTAGDGTSVIDADQIVDELRTAMTAVLSPTGPKGTDGTAHDGKKHKHAKDSTGQVPGPVVGIGLDTFASSLVAVGADGKALTPCITYADTRGQEQVARLIEQLDTDALHERTGARMHTSYTAPRLLWLREQYPDVFARTTSFMSLGEYVAFKLLGTPAQGTASAAWSGLIDRRTGQYVPELLEAVGVSPDQLGAPRDPADTVPVAGTPLARHVPLLDGAAWVPVIGDGLAANIGIGATGTGTWGISTATSGAIRQLLTGQGGELPDGLWAYRVDGDRTLVGSAMSDCGRVLDFARSRFALPQALDEIDIDTLLTAVPDAATPLVVPFLSGERGTKWRGDARAIYANVSASTTPAELLRGSYEGIALAYLRIADQLREVGGAPQRIVLSGGMTDVAPQWLQILADALQAPIDHVGFSRSTMRGSALLALEQTAPDAPLSKVPVLRTVEPVTGNADYYRERLARFEVLADVA